MKPFLRWAGGKSRIVPLLTKFVPQEKYGQYWEPFLGAAALFFSLSPEKACLSDSNYDLIMCYEYIKSQPNLVRERLVKLISHTSEKFYYDIRDLYNRSRPSAAQAARFVFLNKTSFNGIFRVNSKGYFNVPYGRRKNVRIPSADEFRAISDLLKKVTISAAPYDVILADNRIRAGDFVYLDPPYPPLNDTSYFRHYTPNGFSWEDQEKVALLAGQLKSRGCFVMISNADIPRIRKLYEDWELFTLPVTRWIAANGSRHKVNELVITSYSIKTFGRQLWIL